MKDDQDYLREQVKRLKWQEGMNYKCIAEELLGMKYNSFINFIHGYKKLGYKRARKLKEYVDDIF